MKNHILLIGIGFLWACSGDPAQQGLQDRSLGRADVETANATSSGISSGSQTDETPKGSVDGSSAVANAMEGGSGSGNNAEKAAEEIVPVSPVGSAPVDTASEEAVTPPNKITGAFLVGTILPQVEGGSVKVGLVAKKDETRLSDEPERFTTTWGLSFAKDDLPASLVKSKDAAYDRILVFEGTEAELRAQFDSITIQLGVVEGGDGTLNSLVTQTLRDLFAP